MSVSGNNPFKKAVEDYSSPRPQAASLRPCAQTGVPGTCLSRVGDRLTRTRPVRRPGPQHGGHFPVRPREGAALAMPPVRRKAKGCFFVGLCVLAWERCVCPCSGSSLLLFKGSCCIPYQLCSLGSPPVQSSVCSFHSAHSAAPRDYRLVCEKGNAPGRCSYSQARRLTLHRKGLPRLASSGLRSLGSPSVWGKAKG